MKLRSVGTGDAPRYVSDDGRVEIRRFGSLPSMQRWVAFVDGARAPGRTRRRSDAVAAAETALGSNLLDAFADADPWVAAWRAYPDVDEATDEAMPACVGMTEAFIEFARSRGVEVRTVTADEAEDGEVWTHVWARLPDGTNVDWTAPQFHNLRSEPTDLPVPLVWQGGAADHPVVSFAREVVT